MARRKVKLAWIANDLSRRATYKKRKKGLLKKMSEMSTLCDVNACAIIYGPDHEQPEVWPSVAEAQQVALRMKSLPEMEQNKKMMNQESFLTQRMEKLKDQLRKQQKENRRDEIALLLRECLMGKGLQHASLDDLNDLALLIDSKTKSAQERIEFFKANAMKQLVKEEGMKMKAAEEERVLMALENVMAVKTEAGGSVVHECVKAPRLQWL